MTKKNSIYSLLGIFIASMLFQACTVVKHYPRGNAFFFENSIKIDGNIAKEKKAEIRSRLFTQIEDSAQVKIASRIPWPYFPFVIPVSVIEAPIIYNRSFVLQSVQNMKNSMSSMGFRRNSINFQIDTIINRKQQRIKTSYNIQSGPLYTIDSLAYVFTDTTLQQIASANKKNSIIVKGNAFDYNTVDMEIGRLTDLFQNNGYYKISKEDIVAEVDTNYSKLLNATLDAFETVDVIANAEKISNKPLVDIYFKLRATLDKTHINQYSIGTFIVYPDITSDDEEPNEAELSKDSLDVIVRSLHNNFSSSFIKSQIQLKPGSIFKREDYSRTLNNFNKLGPWQNINLAGFVNDEKKQLNYLLKLQPAKRQYFNIDLEGSSILNSSQLSQVGSGRVGLATNFTLKNRNIGKKAIQLENNLRTGIEFNNFKKILSGEMTLTNRITFPWMVAPVSNRIKSYFQQARTIASADYSYIDRFQFFRLNTFNTFLGYEWKPNTNTAWQFKPLNFEYTRFHPDSLFIESIKNFPLLGYTYNNGLIIGMNVLFNKNLTPTSTKNSSLLKIRAEESGIITGALFSNQTNPGKILSNLYRFLKMDIELKHVINGTRDRSLHLRAFAGAGLAFNTGSRRGQVTLPFFKSFFAGGPNSMRGWPIRKLGIGSNVFYDTVANGTFNDKYADIQLEANAEYRFNLFQFYGFWMRGAVFTDVGNIWFRNDLDGTLKNAGFKFSHLGRDIAVASGFGARVDFDYFLLRFDLGFPIKDPRYSPNHTGNANIQRFYTTTQGGWFVDKIWNKPAFQFAIGYPF